eukprot:TRINITY_DN2160_c0_g1_i1.p1 TRINITY_DN2160_c0_g1~~TRINITY_DN2160_c0_g1_i1.p1  ORF type:complete len:178 (+),score=24.36 TRINITY_DN2160_c0_g1_i1:264-797(+)
MGFTEIAISTPKETILSETSVLKCDPSQPLKDPSSITNSHNLPYNSNADTSTQTNVSFTKVTRNDFVDIPLHFSLDHTVITIPVPPPSQDVPAVPAQPRFDFSKKEVVTCVLGITLVLSTLIMFICGFIFVNALVIIIAFVPFPFGSCLISYSSNSVKRRRRGLVTNPPAKKVTFGV